MGLWCLGDPAGVWSEVARWLAVLVLVSVLIGYRPRLTSVPHWYVAFSLPAALSFSNGGDHAAQILALLMVPICLGDDRVCQWRRPRGQLPPSWHGAALSAHLVLRIQIAGIYLQSAAAKVVVPEWRDGTATTAIARHPGYGFPAPMLELIPSGSWLPLIGWGAIGTEIAIGLLILGTQRFRRVALGLGVALHLSILATMGLASFELTMIAFLIAGANLRKVSRLFRIVHR